MSGIKSLNLYLVKSDDTCIGIYEDFEIAKHVARRVYIVRSKQETLQIQTWEKNRLCSVPEYETIYSIEKEKINETKI
jgi:hypothetical protein